MKTIIFYTALIGILSGGIYYYVQSNGGMDMTTTTISETPIETTATKDVVSLTKTIAVVHPKWSGNLVAVENEPGRVKREKQGDTATIVELTDNSITVSWDKWGVEEFVQGENGKYTLNKK